VKIASLWDSWILRVQVFVVGAAIMSLELTASRILAPDFGNSIFVWGSLIGVILTALSLGYFSGGRLADIRLSGRIFCATIFLAGLLVLFIPFFSPIVIELALGSGLGLQYGPLVVTGILMGLPTYLLGMIAPYAIKLATGSLSNLGNVAGGLYSISTVGSIVGTFATVFVLIPSIGVRSIVTMIGIALIAVSFPGLKWGPRAVALGATILVLSPITGLLQETQLGPGDLLYEKDTPYSHMEVKDVGDRRYLLLNGMPDSAMYLNDSVELVFPYTRYFAMGWVYSPNIAEVLFVGGGGFSGPKKFLRDYPAANIDVVEIDPDVIRAARQFFDVEDHPRMRIYSEDGRTFLTRTKKTYDLIVLDAYTKTYVPFHLLTREFYELLRKRLSPDGVIVSNLISSLVGDTSELFWAEWKTVNEVFPNPDVYQTSRYGPGWVQNVMLVAGSGTELSGPELEARAGSVASVDSDELASFMENLWEGPADTKDLPILTDDYSPVELLLNPVTGQPYDIELEANLKRSRGAVLLPLAITFAAVAASVAGVWLYLIRPAMEGDRGIWRRR
jgi:spermidine synthase